MYLIANKILFKPMTGAASEILGKERWRKKRYESEGANIYREANKRIQKTVKKAKSTGSVLSVRRSKLA